MWTLRKIKKFRRSFYTPYRDANHRPLIIQKHNKKCTYINASLTPDTSQTHPNPDNATQIKHRCITEASPPSPRGTVSSSSNASAGDTAATLSQPSCRPLRAARLTPTQTPHNETVTDRFSQRCPSNPGQRHPQRSTEPQPTPDMRTGRAALNLIAISALPIIAKTCFHSYFHALDAYPHGMKLDGQGPLAFPYEQPIRQAHTFQPPSHDSFSFSSRYRADATHPLNANPI